MWRRLRKLLLPMPLALSPYALRIRSLFFSFSSSSCNWRSSSSWLRAACKLSMPGTSSTPNPVASTVILTFVSNELSIATPQMTSTPSRNLLMNSCISFISSIINSDDGQKETFSITFLALKISLLLSSGECRASSIALVTRFSPSPNPVLIIATPPSFKIVFTSAKSKLTVPRIVIISAILLAAMESVSSALPKAFIKVRSAYISRRRSLLITSKASTCWAMRSTPSSA